jgi:hypothetical protein
MTPSSQGRLRGGNPSVLVLQHPVAETQKIRNPENFSGIGPSDTVNIRGILLSFL